MYIADTGNNRIIECAVTCSGTLIPLVTGLSNPEGVAVDGSGNVYFSDTFNNAIKKYSAGTTTTLVSAGLNKPWGIAVDSSGNVFIANNAGSQSGSPGSGTIMKCTNPCSNSVLTTLASSLLGPTGLAANNSGSNLYFDDVDIFNTHTQAVKQYSAGTVTTLVSTGLNLFDVAQKPTALALTWCP